MADPLAFDVQKVLANVRKASTEDLLHRVTVYRAGMEPEAIEIIEEELCSRGVRPADIEDHARRHVGEVIFEEDGTAKKCSFCRQPAVTRGWGWHRLWQIVPIFPRLFYYCREHQAK